MVRIDSTLVCAGDEPPPPRPAVRSWGLRTGPRGPGNATLADQVERRSDEDLLAAYRTGDNAAFAALVRRHHDDLIRFLLRLTGSRAAAEDAFQETFLQVHLSAEMFDPTRRFKPWLFTIAANKARDALRRNTRRKALDLSAPISGGGSGGDGQGRTYVDLLEIDVDPPGAALDKEERDRLVQSALDELPFALREILLLAYFQRLSYNQIADALGIPLGTVKSRLHAAVAAFARKWKTVSKGISEP
jgi:RNA polymerase sigma-70 factor (ECF subfamily)